MEFGSTPTCPYQVRTLLLQVPGAANGFSRAMSVMHLPEGDKDDRNVVCPAAKRPKLAPDVAAALASSPPAPPGVQTVLWMCWPSTNWQVYMFLCLGMVESYGVTSDVLLQLVGVYVSVFHQHGVISDVLLDLN